ncbi:DUF7553 family protein [Salinarchaeum laminariae]|uniref:DUF7553 family protein n=1 Tax=Salinarchaeum laminariae TaxID=869888 RepID=UPI0020BEE803|nr:hypothetical protein [Salinarchaeum laminariae]
MTREQLQSASDRLRDVTAEAPEELAARIEDQADRLHDLAERDYSVDHGTLARVETKLGNLKDDGPSSVEEAVDAALEDVRAFRSTVEGV